MRHPVTPAGTSNELYVQNKWEENTHTHNTHTCMIRVSRRGKNKQSIEGRLWVSISIIMFLVDSLFGVGTVKRVYHKKGEQVGCYILYIYCSSTNTGFYR